MTSQPVHGPASMPGTARLPRAVLAITVLWCSVLMTWSVLMPAYRSTDEISHISNGYLLLETGTWPGYQQARLLAWVVAAVPPEHAGYTPLTTDTASMAPSFAELRDQTPPELWFGEVSTPGQHPPGYYAMLAGLLAVLPADVPAHVTTWWLRLLSVAMLTPLPVVLAYGARRLRAPPVVVVTAAATPLAIPQLGALGGAVSNDNLMTLTGALTTLCAVYAATGDRRWRLAVMTGVVLALALFTKAFAIILLPLAVGGFLLGGWRAGAVGDALKRIAVVAAIAATTGWWWLANVIRYGTVQPSGHQPALAGGPLDPLPAFPDYFDELVIRIPVRFWAAISVQIGQQPPPFPYWVTTGLFALLCLTALLVLFRARSFAMTRADVVLLLLPFAGTYAAIIAGTWPLYLQTGLRLGLQGRYLYTGLVGIALVVLLGLTAGMAVRRRWIVLAIVAGGGGAFTALSLYKVAGFHWAARDSTLPEALAALRAWSPVGDVGLVLIAALGIAALLTTAAMVVGVARREHRRDAPETQPRAAP